ncbi:MAG: hypothetical protein AAGD01_20170 [Acidobacteriota bacterium]
MTLNTPSFPGIFSARAAALRLSRKGAGQPGRASRSAFSFPFAFALFGLIALLLGVPTASQAAEATAVVADEAVSAGGAPAVGAPAVAIDWSARGVSFSLRFHRAPLEDWGWRVDELRTTAPAMRQDQGYWGFAASTGQVSFSAPLGAFYKLGEGELRFDGGLVIEVPGADGSQAVDLSLAPFTLRALEGGGGLGGSFEVLDAEGRSVFTLENAHIYLERGELRFAHMDLVITPTLAERLGKAHWAGLAVAEVDVLAEVTTVGTRPQSDEAGDQLSGACQADYSLPVDVELTSIGSLSVTAREPGVRLAMAPSAWLENVGAGAVRWFRAIAPDGNVPPSLIGDHPFLVMNFYRAPIGRPMRQIGGSDVKHAFYTINTGCPCAGGQILYVGCADVYGSGNNTNTRYLAPREEVSAFSGDWESAGSHFDGDPVDDFRNHGGNEVHDAFEHRLVVQESELGDPNSRYFVEAWYVVRGDINLWNGIGWREVNPTFDGNSWSFPYLDDAKQEGAALDGWLVSVSEPPAPEQDNQRIETSDGRLQVAYQVGGGLFNVVEYNYSLMNLDYDRQVRSITMPFPAYGTLYGGLEIFDGDTDASNDWGAQVSHGALTISAPVDGSGNPFNGLDWGRLLGVHVRTDAVPHLSRVLLEPLETPIAPGTSSGIFVDMAAPASDDLFDDGFDDGTWDQWSFVADDGGDLAVTAAAAMDDTAFGLEATADDTASLFVRDDKPIGEWRYRARFAFDPNDMQMNDGLRHKIFQLRAGAGERVVTFVLRREGAGYTLRVKTRTDAGVFVKTPWLPVKNRANSIELDWARSNAEGADDGFLKLWMDGTLAAEIDGLDNDTFLVYSSRLGLVGGVDDGTTGSHYFDGFVSRRLFPIGNGAGL